jgi:predicted PurR-regulated permease PerM
VSDIRGISRNGVAAKALTIGLGAAVVLLLLPYVSGLIGAAILYVVAAPLTHRAADGRRRRIAAFATVFVLFCLIVVPGVWLLAELAGQIPSTLRTMQQSAALQRLMAMRIGDIDVGSQLQSASADIVRWSSRQTLAAAGGIASGMLNLVIALFGAYYLLVSSDVLWQRCKAILPFCPTTSEVLRVRFHRVTEAMLLGVVLAGITQGTLVAIAFAWIGFEGPLLWGAVTAVVSILPIFGSAIVWLPGVLVLLAQQRFTAAIALSVFGLLVVSNIDNALRLVVYRRVSHIHPMVTLVGAFAGVRAFGIAGLLVGPLVVSYAIELFKIHGDNDVVAAEVAGLRGQGFPLATRAISPTPAVAAHG